MTPVLLIALLNAPPASEPPETRPADERFCEVRIEEPFAQHLLDDPVLMEAGGATAVLFPDGNRLVMAVASAVLEGDSARDRLQAERVCRARALAALVAQENGSRVVHTQRLAERTTNTLTDGGERAESRSRSHEVIRTRVEGHTRVLPVVGRWKSAEGDVLYLAVGAVLDREGKPVPPRASDRPRTPQDETKENLK